MIETADLKEAEKAVERDEVLAPGEVVMKQKIPNGHTGLLVWAQGNLRLDDRAQYRLFGRRHRFRQKLRTRLSLTTGPKVALPVGFFESLFARFLNLVTDEHLQTFASEDHYRKCHLPTSQGQLYNCLSCCYYLYDG